MAKQQEGGWSSRVPEWIKFALVVFGAISALVVQGNRFENRIIANDLRSKQNKKEVNEIKATLNSYIESNTKLSNSVSRLAGVIEGMNRD